MLDAVQTVMGAKARTRALARVARPPQRRSMADSVTTIDSVEVEVARELDTASLKYLIAFEQAVGEVGGPLVEAPLETLDDVLDETVESGRLDRAMMALAEAAEPFRGAAQQMAPEIAAQFLDALPSEIRDDVARVFEMSARLAEAPASAWADDLGLVRATPNPDRPVAFLYEQPSEVASLLWAGLRGSAAGLAVMCALTRRSDALRMQALATAWRNGTYQTLRLVASARGSGPAIPTQLVPAEERLDLVGIAERYRAATAALETGD